jgi:signal transduction histidine kinase
MNEGFAMTNRLCIRNKILLSFFLLLLIDLGIVFLLANRSEKELLANQESYSEILSAGSIFNVILTGDLQSGFFINRDVPQLDIRDMTAASLGVVRDFRNNVFMVFGISLLLGIGINLYLAKSVARPVMQLTGKQGMESGRGSKKNKFLPECMKLRTLTESLQNMQKDFVEREQEKSRQESVEITKNLAAGIAHEIKNPINTVGLTVEYLQKNFSPDEPEKRYEFFKLSDNVKNELQRINRIVEGFLRLAKPSVYDFKSDDINSTIRDVASLYEPKVVKEGVEIHLDLDQELPPLSIDRDKMNQVFSNLIINALEAMPRGGCITFLSRNGEENFIEIKVSDNGIGIPKEKINDVFSPYYTTKKQGFGLGLPLIHSIIHRHHGKITVNSEKGVGTDFIIQLPVDFQDE